MAGDDLYFAPIESQWVVRWDKETIVAPSAYDLLSMIGERSHFQADRKYPKRGISYRVFVQYRIMIDDDLSDEAFLLKLAEFGIIELTVTGTKPDNILEQALNFSMVWHGGDENPKE